MIKTDLSEKLHAFKYRQPGETFRDSCNRIAAGLRDNDEHYHAFRSILKDMRFLPGGRIQSAIGAPRQVTAYNCFVSGTIADTMTEGESSIMGRAMQAARTMRLGGGIGYDFSTLRPRGSLIRKLQSTATGPISFMEIFNSTGLAISSSGHRRGAQMGVLRVDHPDIIEFLHAKQRPGALEGFNISVGMTDAFMNAVKNKERSFSLTFNGEVYGEVNPTELYEQIMRSTWDWAEPGILFIDNINNLNNLYYCESIAATNPCGEQPLPPHGACLLGSFNLTKYVIDYGNDYYAFNFSQLEQDIPHVVRAMDNVVDRTIYPLQEQEDEAQNKRRMGLGVTGLANVFTALGYEYGSPESVELSTEILRLIRDECYRASANLAAEKKPFKLFRKDEYLAGKFISTLPSDVRDLIATNGIRNSHLLSIAPTGTISLCADNVSSGIEPVYAHEERRKMYIGTDFGEYLLKDYAYAAGWGKGKKAEDCSADDHLVIHEVASKYVDSAVSKTVNMDATMPWDDFKKLYFRVWEYGGKGLSTFNKDGRRFGIRTDAEASDEGSNCTIDPNTGKRDCQ